MITASKRYAKICKWLNKWNVLVAFALIFLATAALAAFVAEVKERPLHAFVATHNVGSIRVLEKCEFVPSPEHDPSIAGEDGIHEVLYVLSRGGV